MNILTKLFANKPQQQEASEPGNDQLISAIKRWSDNPMSVNFNNVLAELYSPQSFLLLPVAGKPTSAKGWNTSKNDTNVQLTSVSSTGGLTILSAFTDYASLKHWSQTDSNFITLQANDLLKHCETNGIDKIIVNAGLPGEFVIDRSNQNIKTTTIEKGTDIVIGPAEKKLDIKLQEKLIAKFENAAVIKEAYQFEMGFHNGNSSVVGVTLSENSENAKNILRNAVNSVLLQQKAHASIDVIVLDNQEILSKVRQLSDALFYKSKN